MLPDLILLDIQMPGMTGINLAKTGRDFSMIQQAFLKVRIVQWQLRRSLNNA